MPVEEASRGKGASFDSPMPDGRKVRPIDVSDPSTGGVLSSMEGRRYRRAIDRVDPTTGDLIPQYVGYRQRIQIDRDPP